MKEEDTFRIMDNQINQLQEEINDLLSQEDDIQETIKFKLEKVKKLRKQLEYYDPDYKTFEDKLFSEMNVR